MSSPHNPPPLEWVPLFVESVGRALGLGLSYRIEPSVNPLMYKLKLTWEEPLGGEILVGVWNLLQMWLARNDATYNGKVETTPTSLATSVVVKRRLGVPKKELPWA